MANGRSDFDFFIGSWRVRNRKLRARLAGSNDWDEFDGTAVARAILGGAGNVNDFVAAEPSGPIHGFALRLFDPASGQWSIYWAGGDTGRLDLPPMVGSFREGRGEFYNQETFEGRPVFVRFVWSDVTPSSCRWDQAFSADGGRSWETNWTMEFARASERVDEERKPEPPRFAPEPAATCGMLIRRPVPETFAAFVDPEITTRFWFTRSSGRLESGKSLLWEWEMYGISIPVTVEAIEPDRRIVVEWPAEGGSNRVEWTFTPWENDSTFVRIVARGFTGDAAAVRQQVADATQGFSLVLAGLKALLEHGVRLELVRDRFPKGLEEH
jgi:uncharacterized protein YndB with AHSA1/START domain